MDKELAVAQAFRYAEELRDVFQQERAQARALEDALQRLEASYSMTVRALASALELRDDDTGDHAERVTRLALHLAEQAAPELVLDPELEYGFFLHDLGKIGVPDGILLKAGPLEPEEFDVMRRHPVLGEGIIKQIPTLNGLALQVVRSHHERWDGGGYPDGLRGEEIPTAARIFSVVDAFDAMTNDRPYRRALSRETAIAEIERAAGKQFDPQVAELFVELVPTLRNVA